MSCPRRADRGSTLLEMCVALVVLSLTVIGLSRLVLTHSRLIDSMDGWCRGEPRYYLTPSAEPLERLCGVEAAMTPEPPEPSTPAAQGTANDVAVVSVTRELSPARVQAIVQVTPR